MTRPTADSVMNGKRVGSAAGGRCGLCPLPAKPARGQLRAPGSVPRASRASGGSRAASRAQPCPAPCRGGQCSLPPLLGIRSQKLAYPAMVRSSPRSRRWASRIFPLDPVRRLPARHKMSVFWDDFFFFSFSNSPEANAALVELLSCVELAWRPQRHVVPGRWARCTGTAHPPGVESHHPVPGAGVQQ